MSTNQVVQEQSPVNSVEDIQADMAEVTGETDDSQSINFSWQASEYIHHEKSLAWYLILAVATLVLAGGMALAKQWFSIPVILVMGVAIAVYGAKQPRTLSYLLDDQGITIGQKFYPYDQFRSFAVIQDVAWHAIDLEPTQRFMPRLTILFDSNDFSKVVSNLILELPENDRKPDLIEKIARYLKF